MYELITYLLQAVLAAAVPVVSGFAVKYLNAKAAQAETERQDELFGRYTAEALDAVSTAVHHISQTYVDALKESGTWKKENQRKALDMALAEAKSLLTTEASKFLTMAYSDLAQYLTAHIEAEIHALK